ncbi:MAG: hypothetical protein Q8P95_01490 [bacterium]|nr:hypothetical protein [bacterium]
MTITKGHHSLIIIALLGLLIFWFGRLSVQYQIHAQLEPVQVIAEINPKVPQVSITDIQGAKVYGQVNDPQIRLKSGDQLAVPDNNLKFELDIQHLGYVGDKREVIKHTPPAWAQFVASKNGKYFYEVDEKSGKNLSIPTRVYFRTEEEALSAGYQKRKR